MLFQWHFQRPSRIFPQEQQVPTDTAGWTTGQVVNFPNTVSMLRLLSGPLIAHWILQSQWNLAVPGLAIAGASDWLDGQLARRSGQSSVLGSYLDPLADKVLVGAVVAALGYTGALPLPLVGVIVGRDAFLVTGAVALRAQSLNWRWPGAREFFRIVPAADGGGQQPELGKIDDPLGSRRAPAAAFMKPLMVSKVNTGLQLVLVGACMTDAWVNWPGSEAVWGLGAATAVTTVWSCGAYVAAYVRGGVKGVAS
jgi:cardiolipin synthase (CMP-forming)